ncbi:Nitroreductase-like protein [Pyronema domesticum]|uniref:Similar to Putative nitroreductase HBN1 acc. no. Q96VH4 n=1 Tax=Pyronema omphalodes (strain CBS 100304) TaxID=1076935 RepID=U4L4M5_PYROM|nr:Nitroreductase-like protein [Pyronema domesticum]CCX10695.1 Similar to Putative nitroreductase HBN1; acc. no. Q96VH4 [Pyronema omphalodes CBS 100304]
MSSAFLDAVRARRTVYALEAKSPIADSKIIEVVNETVKHVPSSYNSQSARAVVLFKAEHEKLWDITIEVLKAIVPEDAFPATLGKLNAFKAGYGTVLFFEDQDSVRAMQEAFPLYADRFPEFSAHASGMHQFVAWTALEAEGFGANLQHYNPLIDEKVAAQWNIPASWKLQSQLVFGAPVAPAGEKTFRPLEERVKVFGADA